MVHHGGVQGGPWFLFWPVQLKSAHRFLFLRRGSDSDRACCTKPQLCEAARPPTPPPVCRLLPSTGAPPEGPWGAERVFHRGIRPAPGKRVSQRPGHDPRSSEIQARWRGGGGQPCLLALPRSVGTELGPAHAGQVLSHVPSHLLALAGTGNFSSAPLSLEGWAGVLLRGKSPVALC